MQTTRCSVSVLDRFWAKSILTVRLRRVTKNFSAAAPNAELDALFCPAIKNSTRRNEAVATGFGHHARGVSLRCI